jgi:hypothetical protein
MTVIQDIIDKVNVEVLKMPLGFIRLVQLLFVIIAFASLADYRVNTTYSSIHAPAHLWNSTAP